MRYIHRHILLVLLSVLCFWPSAAAAPQSDNYDKALDKYAYICDRCVEMRAKVESGQSIKMESLGSLMAELSSFRKTLSNASGKMSAAQTARFEAIKVRYMQGMMAFGKKPDRPKFISIQKISPVTEPVEVTSKTRQAVSLRWLVGPVEPQAQRPELVAQRLVGKKTAPEGRTQVGRPCRCRNIPDPILWCDGGGDLERHRRIRQLSE